MHVQLLTEKLRLIRSSRTNLCNQYDGWQETRVIRRQKHSDETHHKAVSECTCVIPDALKLLR
jgi:hypothetical protein